MNKWENFQTHKMNDKWMKFFLLGRVHILPKLLLHFVNASESHHVTLPYEKESLVNYTTLGSDFP